MQTKDTTSPSDNRRRQTVGEIVRFGIVGVIATAIQYGVYWLLLPRLAPSLAMTIAYAISFAFNFTASTRFTFRVKASVSHGAGSPSPMPSTISCR